MSVSNERDKSMDLLVSAALDWNAFCTSNGPSKLQSLTVSFGKSGEVPIVRWVWESYDEEGEVTDSANK